MGFLVTCLARVLVGFLLWFAAAFVVGFVVRSACRAIFDLLGL